MSDTLLILNFLVTGALLSWCVIFRDDTWELVTRQQDLRLDGHFKAIVQMNRRLDVFENPAAKKKAGKT